MICATAWFVSGVGELVTAPSFAVATSVSSARTSSSRITLRSVKASKSDSQMLSAAVPFVAVWVEIVSHHLASPLRD